MPAGGSVVERPGGRRNQDVDLPDHEGLLSLLVCPSCKAPLFWKDEQLECPSDHSLRVLKKESMRCSNILHLDPRGQLPGPLVLKIPLLSDEFVDAPGETEEEKLHFQVEQEKSVISSLARQGFATGPYRVPELVPGAFDGRSILMRRIEGRSLQEELYGWRSWLRPNQVAEGFERAGRWLGRLTATTASDILPFDPSEVTERTLRFLSDLVDYGHPPDEVQQLADLVDRLGQTPKGEMVARCLVHGDFRTSHVLIAPQAVTVIDFEQARSGWAHEDAAFFLASVDGFSARNPLRRWSPAGRLVARRFIRGYTAEAPSGWAAIGDFLRVAAMIRALRSNYRGKMAHMMPDLFRAVVLPHYRRWFEHASERLA